MINERPLRRTEAAEYITSKFGIPCSPKTLAKLACVSDEGPPFRKAGSSRFIRAKAWTRGPRQNSVPRFATRRKPGAPPNSQTKRSPERRSKKRTAQHEG